VIKILTGAWPRDQNPCSFMTYMVSGVLGTEGDTRGVLGAEGDTSEQK
jgi:hypothetical protein